MALRSRVALLALLLLALAGGAHAQFPGKKEKVKAPAVKSDIKCVCRTRCAAVAPLSGLGAGSSAAACARSLPRTWRAS
jgi:hypothetical protein